MPCASSRRNPRQDGAPAAAGNLRPGPLTSTLASAKASLRSIARRWLLLDAEIKQHDAHLETLTAARAPQLLEAHGIASGTAAEMLLLVGDNPERIHSEVEFAKRRAPPDPRIKRQNHPAPRLHREATVRPMPRSIGSHHPYARPPADTRLRPPMNTRGGQVQARNHTLPQTLRGAGEFFGTSAISQP